MSLVRSDTTKGAAPAGSSPEGTVMADEKPIELDIYEVEDAHGNLTTMQLNADDAEAFGDRAKRVGKGPRPDSEGTTLAEKRREVPANKSRTQSN